MNIINDFIYRRNDILSAEKLPEKDVKYCATLHYYANSVIPCFVTQTVTASIQTIAQKFFQPFCFFSSSVITVTYVYKYFWPKSQPNESLTDCKNRLKLDTSDPFREIKLHVVTSIQNILSNVPEKNWPRISFACKQVDSFSNTISIRGKTAYDPFSNTISISELDFSKEMDILEAKVAHEIGHYYNRDQLSMAKFIFGLDCMKLGAIYVGNFPLIFLANFISNYASIMFKSFREKEADRFSVTRLMDGAKKNIRSLCSDVDLDEWKDKNYTSEQQYLLAAATSEKGIFGSHPTESQRITYIMQYSDKRSSFFKELYRFLSTPFHGNLEFAD